MEPACYKHSDKTGKYYCSKYQRYLCDDCISCQDPSIYCKFRKMCFIWEVVKHGTPDMQDAAFASAKSGKAEKISTKKPAHVKFMPSNKTVDIEAGTTLLEAAHKGDVYINARCGGKGLCGSCRVKVDHGNIDFEESPLFDRDKEKGFVLACKAKVTGDVVISVPEENKARALKIVSDGSRVKERLLDGRRISPVVTIVPLELSPPTLDDASSDLERVRHALSKAGFGSAYIYVSLPVLRDLSASLRTNNWKVNIALLHHGFTHEIIKVDPYNPTFKLYGIAVDMGTTSVVAYLTD
jgi:uncharacterized 2Fe-2S/4Fe-4S cluster protein (DUF4445 family)